MRLREAGSSARAEASISSRLQRERETMMGPRAVPTSRGDGADGLGVAVGGDGEASFEEIYSKGGELVGHAKFFFVVLWCNPGDCSPSRRVVSKKTIWFGFGIVFPLIMDPSLWT